MNWKRYPFPIFLHSWMLNKDSQSDFSLPNKIIFSSIVCTNRNWPQSLNLLFSLVKACNFCSSFLQTENIKLTSYIGDSQAHFYSVKYCWLDETFTDLSTLRWAIHLFRSYGPFVNCVSCCKCWQSVRKRCICIIVLMIGYLHMWSFVLVTAILHIKTL